MRKEVEKIKNISRFNEGVQLVLLNEEIHLRMEKEIEDTEFRLKRGSDLGRFDQFWDDDILFRCRYSRSKWLYLSQSSVPLEIYSHALKGNKNIIHVTFSGYGFDSDLDRLQATICDLPQLTSISSDTLSLVDIHRDRDPLFISSTNNDLTTFAKEIRLKLDSFSTYIFTDAGGYRMPYSDKLGNNARVLISFVAPTLASGQRLILRLKHSGREDGPLEVTLGSTTIYLIPSSTGRSSFTIDDITLYPIRDPGPSKSDCLSFEPGIRNEIFIQFRGTVDRHGIMTHGHFLHDIKLVDEAGLEDPRNQIINVD